MNDSDKFWFSDVTIIFHKDRLVEFFPSKEHTLEEKLNSLVRLSFYLSLMLYAYKMEPSYLFICILTCIGTIVIYNSKIDKETTVEDSVQENLTVEEESSGDVVCTPPTLNNPFMNATMNDYLNVDRYNNIIDRPEACDTNDPKIKQEIDRHFGNNLFTDVDDLFGKMNSQRQFYTMPSTTIPNKQEDFAKWLYLNPKTCKEDQDYCLKYEDVRAKRPVLYNEDVNPI
jgi:hypothetical protein